MSTTTKTDATQGAAEVWELAENATMRLPHGRSPTLVRVERGTILVTQEGDLEDHVLEAGDELILRARSLAVAWAFTEGAISLLDAGAGRFDHFDDRPSDLVDGRRSRRPVRLSATERAA